MKIVCIGRNYAEHAKELNNPLPKEPVIFIKPETALADISQPYEIPEFTHDLHHEIEIALLIGKEAKNIRSEIAMKFVQSIGLAIDFTARDLQSELKSKGLPWEKAKAFDGSACLGKWCPVSDFDLSDISFRLEKNGVLVQRGNSSEMLFSIPELLEQISRYFTLMPGDIVLTGTPCGVGAVHAGDILEAYLEDQLNFSLQLKV